MATYYYSVKLYCVRMKVIIIMVLLIIQCSDSYYYYHYHNSYNLRELENNTEFDQIDKSYGGRA